MSNPEKSSIFDHLEVIEPDRQPMIEVDNSAGHAKYCEDGLHVGNINVKYGGKPKVPRDTVMTEGCLGPGEAKIYFNGGQWSAQLIEGITERTVDLNLELGDTQRMVLMVDDPPPFYNCDAPVVDIMGSKGTMRRGKQSVGDGSAGFSGGVPRVVQEGYVGKAKGMRQLLWERGLYVNGMSAALNVLSEKIIDLILANSPDFKNEKTTLQSTIESRGHILLMPPKFHPEVAGVGIEYSWSMSKQKFRRELNDEQPKNLHTRVRERVRRFARRTRDYCRSYMKLALQNTRLTESRQEIEYMRKVVKMHRNIMNMEPRFIDQQ